MILVLSLIWDKFSVIIFIETLQDSWSSCVNKLWCILVVFSLVFTYIYIQAMVECKYPAVEGCIMFSEAAVFVNMCMYAVTASMEASTSNTLDFFSPLWLSKANFSSDIPASQFCFRVCLICSSVFLFIFSKMTHLHDCHSFDNQFFLLKGPICHLSTQFLSPSLAEKSRHRM